MKLKTKKILAFGSILTVFAMALCFNFNANAQIDFEAVDAKDQNIATGSPTEVIARVSKGVLGVMAGLAVLIFIIAGIIFIISGSKPEWQDMARNYVTYAIIGLVIALLGYVILFFITTMIVGGESQK